MQAAARLLSGECAVRAASHETRMLASLPPATPRPAPQGGLAGVALDTLAEYLPPDRTRAGLYALPAE